MVLVGAAAWKMELRCAPCTGLLATGAVAERRGWLTIGPLETIPTSQVS